MSSGGWGCLTQEGMVGRLLVERRVCGFSRQLDKGAVTYMHLKYMYLVQADKYVEYRSLLFEQLFACGCQ